MWQPSYATKEQLKAYVSIPADDTVDDTELTGKIVAASRSIDQHTRRQFGQVDEAELRSYTATARAGGALVVIDDLQDTADMAVMVDGAAVTPDRLWPTNAVIKGGAFTRMWLPTGTTCAPDAVEITALWGWTAVPATIVEATLLQASRLFKRRDAPFGVAGSPDLGSEIRLLAKVDPDVAVMLRPYVRRTGVA